MFAIYAFCSTLALIALISLCNNVSSFNYITELLGSGALLVIISWKFVSLATNRINAASIFFLKPNGKAVLVTGCDTGFGHLTALLLNKSGFTVFATCLSPNGGGAMELKAKAANAREMHVLRMNVTKDKEVSATFAEVISTLEREGKVLWGIVNNAGVITPGLLEWGSIEGHFRPMMEVNVIGGLRVVHQFLPLIEASKGRIVNISSLASRTSCYGCAFYSMTKYAVNAYTEGIRQKVADSGVKAITIEPVFYETPIMDRKKLDTQLDSLWEETPPDVRADYGEKYFMAFKWIVNKLLSLPLVGKNPEEVAEAVEVALRSPNVAPAYSLADMGNKIMMWLCLDVLPNETYEFIMKLYGFAVNKASHYM